MLIEIRQLFKWYYISLQLLHILPYNYYVPIQIRVRLYASDVTKKKLLNLALWRFGSLNLTFLLFAFVNTLYNTILRIARNFLEARENIKILTHPLNHTNFYSFSWEWSKKIFFDKKKIKMTYSKKLRFSKSPILNLFFCQIFTDLSLG